LKKVSTEFERSPQARGGSGLNFLGLGQAQILAFGIELFGAYKIQNWDEGF
jgi:hypothetical protein